MYSAAQTGSEFVPARAAVGGAPVPPSSPVCHCGAPGRTEPASGASEECQWQRQCRTGRRSGRVAQPPAQASEAAALLRSRKPSRSAAVAATRTVHNRRMSRLYGINRLSSERKVTPRYRARML